MSNTETSSQNQADQPAKRKHRILIIISAVALLILCAGAAYYWWSNRAITPIVLDSSEQQALENKMEHTRERSYEPGKKVLVLTEREVNALFHRNTGLGDKVRFELAKQAVHARIRTELDQDIPLIGGRTLKAKARFILNDLEHNPAIILEDLTVWGISLPNAWLAELKGKNLISNFTTDSSNNPVSRGIHDIKVDHGKITIHLAD